MRMLHINFLLASVYADVAYQHVHLLVYDYLFIQHVSHISPDHSDTEGKQSMK